MNKKEEIEIIKNSPIMLLEPAKIMSHRKFKYSLDQCPLNPQRKFL
jgi:dsRNA-specific ribonuclease